MGLREGLSSDGTATGTGQRQRDLTETEPAGEMRHPGLLGRVFWMELAPATGRALQFRSAAFGWMNGGGIGGVTRLARAAGERDAKGALL
ncbi:unnamed protein product [Linum trigynum]|uniref:Uncharacterized protein n=1 Tax=Linum trigynum TaxID=586398 RepID=A0AAV2G686_9ROSI